MSSLENWDKEVGRPLEDIRIDAGWMSYYGRKILMIVKGMPYRPEWETKAEENIKETIKTLEEALHNLRVASELYAAKDTGK